MDLPPLANYRDLSEYSPQFGDFVFWAGFFSSWVGVVQAYDPKQDAVTVVFGGLPLLLVTMSPAEQSGNSYVVPLSKIKNSVKGTWAAIRHEPNSIIWFV